MIAGGRQMSDIGAYSTTEKLKPFATAAKGNNAAGASKTKGRGAPAAPPVVKFKTVAEFCAEYVPLEYAVEGVVRTNSLYCLTAKTGAGKTAFMVVTALAVVTGRSDILGRDVVKGRVAYLAFENPDDVRMRFKIAGYLLRVDIAELDDQLVILDRRNKPEAVDAELLRLAAAGPFALILMDTLAAFFDGDDINDAVKGGEFMRRLRPFTQIPGLPAVIVAAHPVKNANAETLVPYGSGAILNELDGNLTLWKSPETGVVSLHWQGKLRGLDFTAVPFRFEVTGSPDILDVKGRQVQLPTLMPTTPIDAETRDDEAIRTNIKLLRAMDANPNGSQSDWGNAIERAKSIVNRQLKRLERDKMVQVELGKWSITKKGKNALEKLP
jgi:hypothetical protein